jgi:xylulokinase
VITCGIDIGSTNIKVLLMDAAGRSLWCKSAHTPRVDDGIGPVTDGMALVTVLEDLIIAGWREVGKGQAIAAISSAGIGEDGFCVDKDLRPMGHAIPWFDRRDFAEADELRRSDGARDCPAINFAFATAAAKWLWLSRHRRGAIGREKIWITLADYPLVWWSRVPFISATLLPRTGVFDVFARAIVPSLLDASCGPFLPPGHAAGTVIGPVAAGRLRDSGVVDGHSLCVVGGHDHPIASSAIMRLNRHARIDSIGTANAIFGETEAYSKDAARAGIDLGLPVGGGAGISAMGPIAFSEPLIKTFGSEDAVRQLLSVARIAGEPASKRISIGHAITCPDNIRFRRMLEALAWDAKDFFGRMATAGIPEGSICATGGWARSHALMELRASIYGDVVTAIHEPELTALGAALFAAEAVVGAAPDFIAHREIEVFEPVAIWKEIYLAADMTAS